ncbi:hypothetical protein BDA99DRAFT_236266 [Phascolomyces articulosus]|uniref:Uncharacterized protein n=1 Tax=Phascolomyces articulosus TaxID=60185 RepID=A0AAD5PHJ8_9FUNG|nr:hypothetical protein BDA99DRAFT_236266 [Phascolomyces articulosus]
MCSTKVVLIKIAWLFVLLLVTATFAQQVSEQDSSSSLNQEPSSASYSSDTQPSFANPLSRVPEPTTSGLEREIQKAKLGLDAMKVGKQQADRIKDKLPKVGYSHRR